MAGAIIIMSAIGVLLLVLAGYVLVSGTLASADSIAAAQKDMAQKKDEQVHTAIQISGQVWDKTPGGYNDNLTFDLTNTGDTPIFKYSQMDVFVTVTTTTNYLERYTFNGGAMGGMPGSDFTKTWGYMTITPGTTHPYMLDPGETMKVNIGNFEVGGGKDPFVVIVTTPNGITADATGE